MNVSKQFAILCKNGDLAGLKLFVEKHGPHIETCLGVKEASAAGHVHVLNWWKNMILAEIFITKHEKYDNDAITLACMNGHVDVLDWWRKKSWLTMKYDENALYQASRMCHLKVLDWWLETSRREGLEMKYTNDVILIASTMGHIDVLEWWFEKRVALSGLDFYGMSNEAISHATKYGHPDVLKWWDKASLKSNYYHTSILRASENRHINILDELHKKCHMTHLADFHIVQRWAIQSAIRNNYIDVLAWWYELNSDFYYDYLEILITSENGHVDTLQWLYERKNSETEREFFGAAGQAVLPAMGRGDVALVDWWRKALVESFCEDVNGLMYSKYCYYEVLDNDRANVLEWLYKYDPDASYTIKVVLKECKRDDIFIPELCMEWLSKNGFIHVVIFEILDLYGKRKYDEIIKLFKN